MLGFPPPEEEDRHEEETVHGGADCVDFTGCGSQDDRRRGPAPWCIRTIHLSVETAIWADGGVGGTGTPPASARECPSEETPGRTELEVEVIKELQAKKW